MRWSVGIVGCGGAGKRHAQACRRVPEFELAAAADPDPEALRLFQKSWAVPRGYASLEELLRNEKPDLIILCSPSRFHSAQAKRILESPRKPAALFIEKPVCVNGEELRDLMILGQRSGVGILVNHTRRFDPEHQRLRDQIRSDRFGALIGGRFIYSGGWLNNGTHVVDTLRMLLEREPEVVSACWKEGGRGQDRNLDGELRIGETPVRVEAFDDSYYEMFECELLFERGRIRLLESGSRIEVEEVLTDSQGQRVLVPAAESPRAGLQQPLVHALERIRDRLQGKGDFSASGSDLGSASLTMRAVWRAQAAAGMQEALR